MLALSVFLSTSTYAAMLIFVQMVRDGDLSIDGLQEAAAVAVSADGRHLFVAARTDDALAVFRRDESTGAVTFVEKYRDELAGVNGLDGAISVAVSRDDRFLYVAGFNDDALAVFQRNPSTGKLTFVEWQKDGFASVEGLDGPVDVAISPDNKHIYVAGFTEDALAVFGRDANTGRLSFIEVQRDGVAGVEGLDGAHSVAISPDNQNLYVAGASGDALAVFGRITETGRLNFLEVHRDGLAGVDGLAGARSVAVSPAGERVYAVGEADNALVMFDRNAPTGTLTFAGIYTAGLGSPRAVEAISNTLHGTNTAPNNLTVTKAVSYHLYVTNAVSPTLTVYQTVAGALSPVEGGVGGNVDLDGLDALSISSDGLNLYAVSSVADALATFDRTPDDGRLTFKGVHQDNTRVDGLDEATWITLSPDGKHAYVASGLTAGGDHAVAVFDRDATTGILDFVEVHQDGVNGVDGLRGASAIAVSPDNKAVYVTGSIDDALVIFSRDAESGHLTFNDQLEDGLNGVNGLQGASAVAVSPDSAYVYVAGYSDNAVAVLKRNATGTAGVGTETLSFVEVHQDGIASADGLRGAIDVVVSPDSQHLYVAGFAEHAIGVYSRDTATGRLSFREVQRDGVDGVDGLLNPRSIIVSPDNQHVYVAAQMDDALVVFRRDTTTGRLTFVQVHRDGVAGVDGLDSPRAVRMGSVEETSYVYVASYVDQAIAIFRRDPASGSLSFKRAIKQGVLGVSGLDGLVSLDVAPSGRHIYTASFIDDAIAVFATPINVYLPFIPRGLNP